MSLSERLAASKPTYVPKFVQWVEALPEDDRKALIAAAKDPAWTHAALVRVIRAEGGSAGKDSVANWRASVAG